MNQSYYYNYLKEYILEVGNRIIGFDKKLLDNSEALEEFLDSRASLAAEEYEHNENLLGGCGHELAMETLLAGLKELEPTEEEKEEEEAYRRKCEENARLLSEDK